MNIVTPKLNVSASVIGHLARQAVSLVNKVGHHEQSPAGVLPTEKQRLHFKGWAITGWEPPHDPTSFPGLISGI
jgi:hypothetical protein